MKAKDDNTPNTLTPPKSPQDDTPKYDRTKVRQFLQTLYLKLKGLCDSIDSKIDKDLNNYDYERKCFTVRRGQSQEWKDKSIKIVNQLTSRIFQCGINLEEVVPEWQGASESRERRFRYDSEIAPVLYRIVGLLNDWKEKVQSHISKSPLLQRKF